MVKRRTIVATIGLLLLGALGVAGAGTSGAATATSGTLSWPNNAMDGAKYSLLALDSTTTNPLVTIQFGGSASMATAYCGATSGAHSPPTVQDQYAWTPAWGFDMTHAQGTTTVTLGCTTGNVLVAAMGGTAGAPTLSVPGGATSTSSATAISGTSTSPAATQTSTPLPASSTPIPATVTPVPPTATTIPTSMPTGTMAMPTGTAAAGDGGSTCTGAPGEVDQNGISVYVWAPGKRTSCAGAGYENGDDPMPAGTHLPPPRPFNFDTAVVAHESPFGFKVYYRTGSEAPAGYQGTNGCGDVRVILHMGGTPTGMQTQFHTVQIAMDQCDAQGVHHILDVAGRINTGVLDQRQNPDSERAQVDRLTATTLSCDGTTTFVCATVWYSAFEYQVPGGSWDGWHHFGFLVENPITLYDPANPSNVHLTGNDGTTTMLRDNQWQVPPRSAVADWTCLFNTVTGVNDVVSPGTAGAWQMHVDPYFNNVEVLEPASGTDHFHPIAGIQYPN